MGLSLTRRHKLFETFTALVNNEQAVEETLSYFSAGNVEQPVTKDFLRVEVQAEIGALRAEPHIEVGWVSGEVRGLRAELHSKVGELLRTARTTQTWVLSTGLSLAGLILAIARFG